MSRTAHLLLAIVIAAAPIHAPRTDEFTSADLLGASVDLECLDYCIVGVCFWLTCGLTGCQVVTTPKVRHRWPDLVVQTNPQPGDMAWTELRDTLGAAAYSGASAITLALSGIPAGGGDMVTDTEHRSDAVRYSDASVIGSPMALITRSAVSMEDLHDTLSSMTVLDRDQQGLNDQPDPSSEIAAELDLTASIDAIAGSLDSVSSLLSDTLGMGFCPSQATPFLPYFLSELDAVGWRTGIPDKYAPQSFIPGATAIGNWPLNTWGSVFPRTGFVIQNDPVKLSAVIAQRAIDITTDGAAPHVYIPFGYSGHREVTFGDYGQGEVECLIDGGRWSSDAEGNESCTPRRSVQWLPRADAATDRWQMVSPTTGQCERFGSADPRWSAGRISQDGRYAWNYWRQYECCLEGPGVFLSSISTPAVCF